MQLVMFSKCLQTLSLPEVAAALVELGLDGVDLTVRPGGHIEPEEVEFKLPEAVDIFADQGLAIGMLTTSVCDAREPYAEAIFATAADCGIEALKLGYYTTRGFGSFWSDFARTMVHLDGIESLAEEYGVSANIHVHSGGFVSATAQTVSMLLEDRNPRYVGAYVDAGHMSIEGGLGGWSQGLDMLTGRINLAALKNMAWYPREGGGWERKVVPLREGLMDFKQYLGHLKTLGYDGVMTFHSEYQGSASFADLAVPELLAQTAEDVAFIKELLAAS